MKRLLKKEIRLSASPLSFLFTAFGLMALIPNYPLLVGAFFICFGIFHTFQNSRENSDVLYTALLPVPKADTVKARFLFCIFIQFCGFAVMTAATVLRMIWLKDLPPYRDGALMNANFISLAYALVIFAFFNRIFVCGFFKTAYGFAKPFIAYLTATFLFITLTEVLHHFPGWEILNPAGFENLPFQLIFLAAGGIAYAAVTGIALKRSMDRFEKIDL